MLVGNTRFEHGIPMGTMGNEDRQDSLKALREKDNWVVLKTKDDKWTQEQQRVDFHQLLSLNKNTREDCWDNKIKGWWRRGDIKSTKCKRTRECWVKSSANVLREAVKDIKEALMTPDRDGSCDVKSLSMVAGFCNLNSLE
jgi:hypothetical protein